MKMKHVNPADISVKQVIDQVIDNVNELPMIKSLPTEVQKEIKEKLESVGKIPFPGIIRKEGKWFIATTPILELCARGKTEEDAIESLKAMIEDYMSDPDTTKPNIENVVHMEIKITNIPIDRIPLIDDPTIVSNAR